MMPAATMAPAPKVLMAAAPVAVGAEAEGVLLVKLAVPLWVGVL